MKKEADITGLILAGGKSKRLGKDKTSLMIGQKTMLEHSIDLLSTLTSDIYISTNNRKHAKYGYPLIEDEIMDCGPIGGLYSATLKISTGYILVIPVDMPLLTTEVLELLIEDKELHEAVVARTDWKIEPLCGLYSTGISERIGAQIRKKDYKMIHLLEAIRVKYVDFEGTKNNYFVNINTADDLDKYAAGI